MPTLDVAINALRAKHGAKQFDDAVKKIKRGAKDVDKGVKDTEKSINTFGASAKKVAVGLIGMAAAYKGLRFAISSVKEFAAFEMGLANISTMLDDSTMKYMPGYEKQVKKMAREFGQSTGTLSKGLYDILSASVSADKAIKVLRVSSKAAIAGLTDTGIAADALTTILNSYGLEAEDAARIGDILFATVKAGKITFGELAASIGKVSSLAAAVGLDFTQVSAAISTMTRAGISSDIAMTSLKGILTTFLSPQKENIIIAAKYGLALNGSTLRAIGLTGAIEKLQGATEEDIAAIFSNVRALTGVAAIRGNLTGLIKDQEAATDSVGMQEEAYQKIAKTTGQELKKLAEDWKAVKVAAGEYALRIPGFITEAGKLIDALDELREARERAGTSGRTPMIGFGGPTPRIPSPVEGWEGSSGVFRQTEDGIVRIDKVLQDHLPALEFYIRSSVKAGEATGKAALGIESFEKAGLPVPAILREIAALEEDMAKSSKKANEERLAGIEIFNQQTEAFQKAILVGEDYQEPVLSKAEIEAIKDLNELVLSKHDFELFLLDDKVEAYRKAGVDEYIIAQIKNAKIAELDREQLEKDKETAKEKEKYIDDEAQAYRRLYDDLGSLGENSYNNKIALLDMERQAYATFIDDKILLDEWYAERKAQLDAESAMMSDDFAAGFSASVKQMENDMASWGQIGATTAQTMKSSFGEAMASMIVDGASWKEAMYGFAMSMLRSFIDIITQMIAMKVMASAFGIGAPTQASGGAAGIGMSGGGFGFESLAPSAKGNIFDRGSIVPFAKGDILTRPTVFPMSNGGVGLGGEVGIEAIMPLGRDKSGRLGVRAEGGGESKQPIKIINVMDQSEINEYLNSADGEKTIVNIMRRNSGEISV